MTPIRYWHSDLLEDNLPMVVFFVLFILYFIVLFIPRSIVLLLLPINACYISNRYHKIWEFVRYERH